MVFNIYMVFIHSLKYTILSTGTDHDLVLFPESLLLQIDASQFYQSNVYGL